MFLNRHVFGGLAVGGLAIVIGIAWALGALRRRRDREGSMATYTATGGITYTVFQLGCAGLLIIGGIMILVLMLLSGQ